MADMKFVLPGPDTVTMSGQTARKLIQAGDGDAALLYLYILMMRGVMSLPDAAKALGRSESDIASSMAFLARLGLVMRDETAAVPPQREDTPEYSADDIKRELKNGSAFYFLVQEVQKSLGKILSSDDLIKLFGIYDSLGLPPDVILQLVTHCISESRRRYGPGHMPTMRYVEKAAYTWEREGIFSLELAEDYLKKLEQRRSAAGEIKKVLQIKDRELTASEARFVDGWTSLGFGPDVVEVAYDKTVLKTGKLTWNYMDSILRSWHTKGLRTVDEITCRDGKAAGRKPMPQSAPDPADIERMKKLLRKMKEE